jgi:hypothetical protein
VLNSKIDEKSVDGFEKDELWNLGILMHWTMIFSFLSWFFFDLGSFYLVTVSPTKQITSPIQ